MDKEQDPSSGCFGVGTAARGFNNEMTRVSESGVEKWPSNS